MSLTVMSRTCEAVDVTAIDRYWRAANYLSAAQIYLWDNPLMARPLAVEHIKPRLLGHWGTTPGVNFVYAHLNRIIKARDRDVIFVCGPGHGGPAVVAQAYLEGTYSEIYPHVTRDAAGLKTLVRQFSFPGGVPSHAGPDTPGSFHEGGELGYSLAHAYGAAFDNPDLVVACLVGDGEAETGALATSWISNRFLDPVHDGAVLPIVHINGYKIAGPTVFGRMVDRDLRSFFHGLGYEPLFVCGSEPLPMHRAMATAMDAAFDRIHLIQSEAQRNGREHDVPRWPVILLRSPKGWTGPKEVDGHKVEGSWRSHQIPVADVRTNGQHRAILEAWLRSYRPQELFDEDGYLEPDIAALAPVGRRRMSANPHADGGLLKRDLPLPDWRAHAVRVSSPGAVTAEATRVLGAYLAELFRKTETTRNFRLFCPDETTSNRLDDVFTATARAWTGRREAGDEALAPGGRVVEVLSEHLCQGWLEGYLLTGRHGLFACYEAFVHVVDSMVNQHAKWLKASRELAWRHPIASLNYLLTSHVWRQDHNGFSHQDPGFLDHVANKTAEIARIYLPPDANTLLWVMDHCLKTFDRINVVVAGKQPAPQWLDPEAAAQHAQAGLGIWTWAGTEAEGFEPDVVLACAGDVPTLETLAAADLLRGAIPDLRIRVVNVVDLMALQSDREHPHGLSDWAFDKIFTCDRPVIFAFHGYPHLVHRLTYARTNHAEMHVHGYREQGTTTTPFDMVVLNEVDRFHLAIDVIDRVPGLAARAGAIRHAFCAKLAEHRRHIRAEGEDLPEIRNWQWPRRPDASE